MKNISYRVALGGIVAALCILTMFLAGILPALYIVLPMAAGILMMIMVVEVNVKWAVLTYFAVSILSIIVTFDKEAALLFVLFFGHYPILRFYIQKIRLKFPRIAVKFLTFNICIISFFYITVYLLGLDQMLEEMNDFGKYGAWIILSAMNIIFVLYDCNLDLCYKVYRRRIMPKFRNK